MKIYSPELAAPLAKQFQYIYSTGIYPTMLENYPANYHHISLLPIISKVMEGVIISAIKQHLLSNNLLSDTQFGFHQSHSAPDLITALVQTWAKELNST
eukprot:g18119.t1